MSGAGDLDSATTLQTTERAEKYATEIIAGLRAGTMSTNKVIGLFAQIRACPRIYGYVSEHAVRHRGMAWAMCMLTQRGFMDGEARTIHEHEWRECASTLSSMRCETEMRRIYQGGYFTFDEPSWHIGAADIYMTMLGAMPRGRVSEYRACLKALNERCA